MSDLDVAFKDAVGLPANAQAKRLAKDKVKIAKLKEQFQETFFVLKNGKLLKMTVKHNGSYSTYLTSKKKLDRQSKLEGKEVLKELITGWKKEGSWLEEYEANDKIAEVVKKLAASYEAALAKKK